MKIELQYRAHSLEVVVQNKKSVFHKNKNHTSQAAPSNTTKHICFSLIVFSDQLFCLYILASSHVYIYNIYTYKLEILTSRMDYKAQCSSCKRFLTWLIYLVYDDCVYCCSQT